MRKARPKEVVFSALGVHEGLLYGLVDQEEHKGDALLAADQELDVLRSREPRHGEELIEWTDRFIEHVGLDESTEEKRRAMPPAC